MQLETLKETLLEVLNIQSKAVSGRSNIPVLSNVLLKADATKLYLYTTNLELSIISWIASETAKQGTTTVSMRRFLEYINTLPEGTLKLAFDANELHVSSRNSKAVFNTIPSEEFPKISEIKEEALCTINSSLFFEAINSVAFAASKDDTRPTFSGIYIEIIQNAINFVAIDGFRLASKTLAVETGVSSAISFIVPSAYIEDIAKMQGDKDEDIKLFIIGNKNQLGVRYKNSDFILRLIEGNYPDYTRVIPHEFTTQIVVDRQSLLNAVKTSSIFSSQREIGKTQIKIEEDHIVLRSFQKEIGENETKIECSVQGDGGIITFNSKYLMDAITHLNADTVLIKVVLKQEKPSVFYNSKKDEKGKDPFAYEEAYFNLMTPIKVENE